MNYTSFVTLFAAAVFCLTASAQPQSKGTPRPLPDGDGKQILENACTTCHPITMITNAGHTREDWQLLMERMVAAGAGKNTGQGRTAASAAARRPELQATPPEMISDRAPMRSAETAARVRSSRITARWKDASRSSVRRGAAASHSSTEG